MPATFILQGLTPRNHLSAVQELLQVDKIKRVLISVAFVSASGVRLIADHVRPHAGKATIFAGIRNGITSAQAIKALLDLGVSLMTVDTGSADLVFHPKLYYVRGAKIARLMVGSANLTAGGMNNNIEASVMIDFDLSLPNDRSIATSIETQFRELPGQHPHNIVLIPTGAALATLLADPRLVDDRTAPARTVARLVGGSAAFNPVPILKMLTSRMTSRRPVQITSKAPTKNATAAQSATAPNLVKSYILAWTTTDLTERDLNIPKRKSTTGSAKKGTNPTGSINLDKGAMDAGFQFQSYFRDHLFNQLEWGPLDARKIERAQADFSLIVEGIDCGSFNLTIRNNTKTNDPSAAQHQPRTRISWGLSKPFVAKDALIGRTLSLSRSVDDPTRFLIEID